MADPAKEAGIQKHNILLAIEDTEILDAGQLKNCLIEHTTPGQEVLVKVRRIDADLTFTVTLAGGCGEDISALPIEAGKLSARSRIGQSQNLAHQATRVIQPHIGLRTHKEFLHL